MAVGGSVRDCKCVNTYQDTTYGNGKRVFTHTNKGYRCTSCGKEESDSSGKRK